MTGWLDAAVNTDVTDYASLTGRDVRRSPSSHHCSCPACGAVRRHPSNGDRRGAVGIPHTKPTTWRCHECNAGGDGLDFISYAIGGGRWRDLSDSHKAEVRDWLRDNTGIGRPDFVYRPAPSAPPPPPAPSYPPIDSVRGLMANALAVHTDSRISEFLNYRGIDSRATWERDLAVGLPWAELPEWAQFGERSWAHSMHRLIVPLRDAAGVTRSVLARSVEKQPLVKSVAPRGYARSGLVMANQCALMMLRNKAKPNIVVVREGELDFVHEALLDDTVAVLGIVSGSWTSEIASRIPVGAHVVVATDADAAGDKYADAIMASLQGRGSLERRRDAA